MLTTRITVTDFADIRDEFLARAHDAVWCVVTSVGPDNRPKARLLHPIWDGSTGWVATFRDSPKGKHIAHNPYMAVTYAKEHAKPLYIDCKVEWADDMAQKEFAWKLFNDTPPPLGYPMDVPPTDPTFGVLKLIPWRIELYALGGETSVWHAPAAG